MILFSIYFLNWNEWSLIYTYFYSCASITELMSNNNVTLYYSVFTKARRRAWVSILKNCNSKLNSKNQIKNEFVEIFINIKYIHKYKICFVLISYAVWNYDIIILFDGTIYIIYFIIQKNLSTEALIKNGKINKSILLIRDVEVVTITNVLIVHFIIICDFKPMMHTLDARARSKIGDQRSR